MELYVNLNKKKQQYFQNHISYYHRIGLLRFYTF